MVIRWVKNIEASPQQTNSQIEQVAHLGEVKRGSEIGRKKNTGHSYYIWSACVDCGKQRWVLLRHGKASSLRCRPCSNRFNHPGQERRRDVYGYIIVRLKPNDPFHTMADKQHNIYEHRLVMAKFLGRCLEPWELVHHKDGVKDHNSILNLKLLPGRAEHLVDAQVKRYMKKLEQKIDHQAEQIRLLQWHICELQKSLQREGIGNDKGN